MKVRELAMPELVADHLEVARVSYLRTRYVYLAAAAI
jgi:hypothetical protein